MATAALVIGVIGLGACAFCAADDSGYARDVAFPAPGHVVVAKWDGGVAVSRDGGTTWSDSDTVPIRQLTIDSGGRLWGLSSWHGIHEPSRAELTCSDDGGNSWTSVRLDPEEAMPEAFVSSARQVPILVASDGQLWIRDHPSRQGFQAWSRLGKPIPAATPATRDCAARVGMKVGKVIYVASSQHVWMSKDVGVAWESFALDDIRAFAGDAGALWAVSGTGKVHSASVGVNRWELMAEIPEVTRVFGAAAKDGRVYVAAEGKGWRALGAFVEKDGSVTVLPGLRGKQGYAARIDPSGRAWFVAQGVFMEGRGKWEQVWP
ncbi:hypothetical protein ACFL59_09370 [Planctomycetota bacterium]